MRWCVPQQGVWTSPTMARGSLESWGSWLKIAMVMSMLYPLACCSNILVVPVDGSHWLSMRLLLEELHDRGHNISVLHSSSSWYVSEEPSLFHCFTVSMRSKLGIVEDHQMVSQFLLESLEILRGGRTLTTFIRNTQIIRKMLWDTHHQQREFIRLLFEDGQLMEKLRAASFALVLTDPFFPAGVMLAHHLQLPLVYQTRWLANGDGHYLIAPSPTSYVPVVGSCYTHNMPFLQRLANAVHYLTTIKLAGALIYPSYRELCHRFLGPGTDIEALMQRADLWLMKVDFVFEFPRPTMPHVVYVGGLHCRPARPLPPDLEEFARGSGEHGVIFMSLGTIVTQLPAQLAAIIAEALAQLPQRVIWKYQGERPANLGNNTLLVHWVPQNDILGDPRTRVFISHGGTNGIYEAIYHGVPVLGLPLIFDQYDNLVRLESRGAARTLDVAHLDSQQLLDGLTEVLNQPSYREAMARLSALHRDQPQTPLQRAAFWVEFVLRHGGAAHLRPASFGMPWYTYHSLDVALCSGIVAASLTMLTFLALRRLYQALRRVKEKQS
ncbi:UDP-glucuronosyltransferase 2C1-like isoform X1 [Stegostoma tigrinum]|uniref:UDP-glucuronosyltransferase 2C1-like isoform X1 n=2 Tax=Stegostoma tigrinum TaxID=3053191 RepID=UPI0028702141|nr:UDP-glucuronosyltransferase 2C1-like isoform X1 [Stegostoma tigrinum]